MEIKVKYILSTRIHENCLIIEGAYVSEESMLCVHHEILGIIGQKQKC